MRDRFLQLYEDLILRWHEGSKPEIIKTTLKAGSMEIIRNGLKDFIKQERNHIYVGNAVC